MNHIPQILLDKADELEIYYREHCPALAPLAKQCFLNTIETTVKEQPDGTCFVITGDIEAMWLRDSSAQVMHYIRFAKEDEELRRILKGVIRKQISQVLTDPYANAFNETPGKQGWQDLTKLNDWVWERKYELDSLCAPIYLVYRYWKETEETDIFDGEFLAMIRDILRVIRTEQHHDNSCYSFQRPGARPTDTLPCEGRGTPVGYTGMSWSGFRPSDDSCTYGYLIPSNMMAVVALGYVEEILDHPVMFSCEGEERVSEIRELAAEAKELLEEIRQGIEEYAVVRHPVYGEMYAYETDGLGHHLLMDDANSPSLLALPYLDYCASSDERYRNTRSFILSKENPYYYEGREAKGIGSPHTPDQYIWHIGIIMQALTSTDPGEIRQCLEYLTHTHADTNFMHESFDKDDSRNYTRSWFAWANSLFAELLLRLKEEGFFEKRGCPGLTES